MSEWKLYKLKNKVKLLSEEQKEKLVELALKHIDELDDCWIEGDLIYIDFTSLFQDEFTDKLESIEDDITWQVENLLEEEKQHEESIYPKKRKR